MPTTKPAAIFAEKLSIRFAGALAALLLVAASPGPAAGQALEPGEAFLTQFSGTVVEGGANVIDLHGTVGSIFDLRALGGPPLGQNLTDIATRHPVAAADIGQIFGVAIDDQRQHLCHRDLGLRPPPQRRQQRLDARHVGTGRGTRHGLPPVG